MGPKLLTDLAFANDIALISEEMDHQERNFLRALKTAADSAGVHCNSTKNRVPEKK